MDIHKPKPWHTLREFLKEYAIIVVGVLTALGAEQAAERLHVQTEVREARAALRQDMGRSLRALTLEAREDACWPGLLDAVEAWAEGAAPKPTWPVVLQQSMGGTAAWDSAKTGAVPHMSLDERLTFARYYASVENQQVIIYRQILYDLDFRGYLERDSLDPQEAHELIRLVGRVRANIRGESLNVPDLLALGRELGAEPGPMKPAYEARVDHLCAAFPPQPSVGGR